MWCQHANGERTNNRCEGFHNKLRQSLNRSPKPISYDQKFKTDRQRIDKRVWDVLGWRRRETDKTSNSRTKTDIVRCHREINVSRDVTAKTLSGQHFLDYSEYYYHKKMTRRYISLKSLSPSKEQLESIVAAMNRQKNNDQLDGTTREADNIVRNDETELFYDWLIDSTVGHIDDCESRPFQAWDWKVKNVSPSVLILLACVDRNGGHAEFKKSLREKTSTEGKHVFTTTR